MRRETLQIVAAYLTIYLVWGSTYFFIKLAVETLSPLYLLAGRWTGGGLLLLAMALAGRRAAVAGAAGREGPGGPDPAGRRMLPTLRQVGAAVLMGMILILGANGLVSVAEREVDSYVAALTMAAVPLMVAFFDRCVFRKRVGVLRVAGIAIGVAGVALLLYDGHSVAASLGANTLMVLAAMLLWSFGTSLGGNLDLPADSRVGSAIQMLAGGIAALILAAALGQHPALSPTGVSARSLLGLVYLAVPGSLAFFAFAFLITHEPSTRVVSYALVNPGIAVLLGLLVGHETPKPFMPLAMPMILLGLGIMLYGDRLGRGPGFPGRRAGRGRARASGSAHSSEPPSA